MDFGRLYFSSKGRLNRKGYWVASIGLFVMVVVLATGLGLILGIAGAGGNAMTVKLIALVTPALFVFPAYNLAIKRLHDRERPEWLALAFLVPSVISPILQFFDITGSVQKVTFWGQETLAFVPNMIGNGVGIATLGVAVWALVELGIIRGVDGANEHGPDPWG